MKVRMGPGGVHLFCRNTGLNVLLDEVHAPESTWACAPRFVSIALANACDLRCPYCYAPKHRAALDVSTVMNWLMELDAEGCNGVGFGGGEPTLYAGFAALCERVAHETRLAVSFTTHGHHLTAALVERLAGNVHFVRVSMDGTGVVYERLRRRPFAGLLRALANARRIGPYGLNYVVNADTVGHLDEAVEIAEDQGACELLLLPERRVSGRGGIDDTTSQTLARWVSAYAGGVPLVMSEPGLEGIPHCDPLAGESGLRAYAHIDASGTVRRNSFESPGITIGGRSVMVALEELKDLGEGGRR